MSPATATKQFDQKAFEKEWAEKEARSLKVWREGGWGLTRIQEYPRLSDETTAFNADITLNGKVVGSAEDDGKGGSIEIRFNERYSEAEKAFYKAFDVKEGTDAEIAIGHLVEAYAERKDILASAKRFAKKGFPITCIFRSKGGIITSAYSSTEAAVEDMKKKGLLSGGFYTEGSVASDTVYLRLDLSKDYNPEEMRNAGTEAWIKKTAKKYAAKGLGFAAVWKNAEACVLMNAFPSDASRSLGMVKKGITGYRKIDLT